MWARPFFMIVVMLTAMTSELSAAPMPAFVDQGTLATGLTDLSDIDLPVMAKAPDERPHCSCKRIGVCGPQQLVAIDQAATPPLPSCKPLLLRPIYDANVLRSHIGLLDPPPPRS
ncbi:MAG: hypothetical protein AAFR75_13590 [Pseudomonadota bacterium]